MANYIKISNNDNVIVCLNDVVSGVAIDGVTINEDIKAGHKVAICDIKQGENVIKYDMPIGSAKCDIKKGDWVHTHNVATNLSDLEDGYKYEKRVNPKTPTKAKKEIHAYKRKNGDIGIRNELWIVPTVGCMNGIAEQVKKRFVASADTSSIDAVNVFTHNYGCSQMGDDHVNTRTILQNIVKHPNCGGVLVLGLGCENNQVSVFEETLGEYDKERVKFLVSKEVEDEIE
jgi:altronate hydrolase